MMVVPLRPKNNMWIFIGLTVLFFLLSIILGIGVIFLIRALMIQEKKSVIYEKWIVNLQNQTERILQTMKNLDDREMFSKDDEVGIVFQEISDLVKSLSDIVTKE